MTIRVDAYTTGGMASGTAGAPRSALRDALETEASRPVDGAAWQGLDDPAPSPTGSLSIPQRRRPDRGRTTTIPAISVHATWHRIQRRKSGPYTVEGELATLPGFDPGRALTRPSGEFLLHPRRPAVGLAAGPNGVATRRPRADQPLRGRAHPGRPHARLLLPRRRGRPDRHRRRSSPDRFPTPSGAIRAGAPGRAGRRPVPADDQPPGTRARRCRTRLAMRVVLRADPSVTRPRPERSRLACRDRG